MPISCAGTDLDECEILLGVFSLTTSVRRELKEKGLPVISAFSPPGLKFALLIVSVEPGNPGIADQIASVVRASKMGVFFQYIVVVDGDVDATNFAEALHSTFTCAHPERGLQIFPLAPGHPLIPFLDLHDKMNARGAGITIDATAPTGQVEDALRRVSFRNAYSEELRKQVTENWHTAYGLPEEPGKFR
jgi:4-hydroxy-3-polyprenylbenzoate decarboxylase